MSERNFAQLLPLSLLHACCLNNWLIWAIHWETIKPIGQSMCTWSSYKHYNTTKYLISMTPQVTISFVSKGWGVRTSDQYITEHWGYLHHSLPGDVDLAAHGFDMADSVAVVGASLDIPTFFRGCEQLTAGEIETTSKLPTSGFMLKQGLYPRNLLCCQQQEFL